MIWRNRHLRAHRGDSGPLWRERHATADAVGPLRSGLLDIAPVRPRRFPLADLPAAMAAAREAGNPECVVVRPGAR